MAAPTAASVLAREEALQRASSVGAAIMAHSALFQQRDYVVGAWGRRAAAAVAVADRAGVGWPAEAPFYLRRKLEHSTQQETLVTDDAERRAAVGERNRTLARCQGDDEPSDQIRADILTLELTGVPPDWMGDA